MTPHPYQGCALPLSYRGFEPVCLVFSGPLRKRSDRAPRRTVQNDSQTRSPRWEMAGRYVHESFQRAHSKSSLSSANSGGER